MKDRQNTTEFRTFINIFGDLENGQSNNKIKLDSDSTNMALLTLANLFYYLIFIRPTTSGLCNCTFCLSECHTLTFFLKYAQFFTQRKPLSNSVEVRIICFQTAAIYSALTTISVKNVVRFLIPEIKPREKPGMLQDLLVITIAVLEKLCTRYNYKKSILLQRNMLQYLLDSII